MKNGFSLSKADLQAIDDLFRQFNQAWASGDAEKYAMLFFEDAKFIGAPGFRLSGRETIQKEHKEMFDSIFKHSSIETTYYKEIQMISEDVVLIHSFGNILFPGQSEKIKNLQALLHSAS